MAMPLLADASVLVANGLRVRGRRFIARPDMVLYIPAPTWSESEHELRRRLAIIARRRTVAVEQDKQDSDVIVQEIAVAITVMARESYSDALEEAPAVFPATRTTHPRSRWHWHWAAASGPRTRTSSGAARRCGSRRRYRRTLRRWTRHSLIKV